MTSIFADESVVAKLQLDTLEGRQPINMTFMFCLGNAGDVWQQKPAALFKKYDVLAIDDLGWMVCHPKPENEVEFFELTDKHERTAMGSGDGYVIQGQWGSLVDGRENMQECMRGDFICRQTYDHTDRWVVRRRLFQNTYTVL